MYTLLSQLLRRQRPSITNGGVGFFFSPPPRSLPNRTLESRLRAGITPDTRRSRAVPRRFELSDSCAEASLHCLIIILFSVKFFYLGVFESMS